MRTFQQEIANAKAYLKGVEDNIEGKKAALREKEGELKKGSLSPQAAKVAQAGQSSAGLKKPDLPQVSVSACMYMYLWVWER